MLNEQESNSKFPTLSAFADLLKSGEPVSIDQLIDTGVLEVEDGPTNEAADTLPTPITLTEKAFANRFLLVDRRIQYLQEQIKENHDTWAKLLELEAGQEDQGHSLDALFPLSQSFQRELTEIRSAQSVDATEIGYIKGDVDSHDDRLDELELESKILQRQIDSLSMQRFTRRCVAADILRTVALAAFGFGIATFIGAAVSGSQQQKDDLANTGALMTVIAVSATAIGTSLD